MCLIIGGGFLLKRLCTNEPGQSMIDAGAFLGTTQR